MASGSHPRHGRITSEHLVAVNELIELEQLNAAGGLSPGQRTRWRVLTQRLFGSGSYHEKRKFFRVQTQNAAEIIHRETAVVADVTSISAGGLFLRTDHVSDEMLGRDLDVVVRFPEVSERSVQFKVQVCRVAQPEESPEPGLGVRFVDLDTSQRHFLLDHLRTHLLQLVELSREKYHFFFQHCSDLALLLSPTGEIVEVSEASERFLGVAAEKLVGQPVTMLIPPDGVKDMLTALEHARQGERPRCTLEILSGATRVPVEVVLTPFQVRELQIGTVLMAHDLREQRRTEEERRTLERRLFQADKIATVGQIAASIASEINNPLAYVLTNMALLEEYLPALQTLVSAARGAEQTLGINQADLQTLDSELTDLIQETVQGCGRIRDIMHNLHDYSRLDASAEAQVDVNQALEASLRIVKNVVQHRAMLERDYADDLPPTYLNFGRVAQVFLGLLTAAVMSFESTERRCNLLRLRTRFQGGVIRVEISDNSRGLSPEMLDRISRPFLTCPPDEGDVGLRLALAREGMESLGGTMEILSGKGNGTTVLVSLPVRSGTRPQLEVVEVRPQSPRRRVLLIDADPILLRSMERALDRYFDVMSTISPTKAIELCGEQRFDTVVCDAEAPRICLADFYAQLTQRAPGLAGKVVFMVGTSLDAEEPNAEFLASKKTLAKPVDVAELHATLRAL